MAIETESISETSESILAALQDDVPKLRLVASLSWPEQQARWAYDYEQSAFVTAARLKTIKPQIALKDQDDFLSQLTTYSESFEYLCRCQEQLILCLSAKELTNIRLLELALENHGESLQTILGSDKKSKAKNDKKIKTVKTTDKINDKSPATSNEAASLSAADLEKLLTRLSGYELLKVLEGGTHLPSFKMRQKSTGLLFVLKYEPIPGLLTALGELPEYKRFESHPTLADHLLMRPFVDGVSLGALIQKVKSLALPQVLFMIVQLCEAQQKLAQPHLGLSPNNILINQNKQILLLDSVMSSIHRAELAAGVKQADWSPLHNSFLAPESLTTPPQAAADIYAIAALAMYMLAGHAAYTEALRGPDLQQNLFQLATDTLERRHANLFSLLTQMLKPSPDVRPSAGEVIRSVLAEAKNIK